MKVDPGDPLQALIISNDEMTELLGDFTIDGDVNASWELTNPNMITLTMNIPVDVGDEWSCSSEAIGFVVPPSELLETSGFVEST